MGHEHHYLGNPQLKAAGVNHNYTEEELEEYVKCSDSPEYFIENYINCSFYISIFNLIVNYKSRYAKFIRV